MPGPRFGGHGRPPFGPPGGPGFRFNRPFPHFDYNIPSAPRQQTVPVGTTMVATFTYGQISMAETMHIARLKKGKVGGIVTGLRMIFSGGIRNQAFQGRMATIDMQLAENRLTKEQANKRKIDAAKRYNRYLLKIGYITREEYVYGMEKFAEKIGVRYVDDTQQQTQQQPQQRRRNR